MINVRVFSLALLAGGLLGGSAAVAQTTSASPAPAAASMAPEMAAPHHRHPNRMAATLKQLDLSDDQKSKIKGIMTSYRSSRDTATPETRKQMRDQVEAVLTPEQRTQFETQMKAHHPAPDVSPAP